MDKNCLFMHEGVIVTQTSDMFYFQGWFLIPKELQNSKVKKTCYSVCVQKEILSLSFSLWSKSNNRTSKIRSWSLYSLEEYVPAVTYVGALLISAVYLPDFLITVKS